ncbi:MAG: S41 family peptidase [Bacteroidales bacterium]|nr:S41 family peptidase [Bacteroidales bacterium]
MKKRLLNFLFLWPMALAVTSCLDDDSLAEDNTYVGNFEACWTAMDEHYCFFDEKGVDWDSVYRLYQPLFRDSVKSSFAEFNLMADMLASVRDGHVNLYSSFNTARYWKWFEDYPQNFDATLLERYYLGTNYWMTSGLNYCLLSDTVAYVRYASFSSSVGETNLDYVLALLSNAKGLIIDVRDNGGGTLTNVTTLANRFCTEKTLYSYIKHKTGTGHNDFSDPEPLYLEPQKNRVNWDASAQPVVVLTNRSCYSATNCFVSAMKSLDGLMTTDSIGRKYPKMIKTVGDRTGGGGGMPFETVLPNSWVLRFSACPTLNAYKESIEDGIDPDIRVDMDSASAYFNHTDDIIEAARAYIKKNTRVRYVKKK